MKIDSDSLNIKNSYSVSKSKELKKIGRTHTNFFILLFKRIILSKKDFKEYLINRGITVIKSRNFDFIKNRYAISSEELHKIENQIPTRALLSQENISEIKHLENYFNIKRHVNELNEKHWLNFVNSQVSHDSEKLNKIADLNKLFLENESWISHEDFASYLSQIAPFNELTASQISEFRELLGLCVSDQANKKDLLKALFLVENKSDIIQFYSENGSILKELTDLNRGHLPQLIVAFSLLGKNLPSIKDFYLKNPILLKNLASLNSPDLDKQLVRLYEWNQILSSKENPKYCKAFINALGVKYLVNVSPNDSSERTEKIHTLFSFYINVIQKKKFQPTFLAQALDIAIPLNKFDETVNDLGSYLSVFRNSDAENNVLRIYKELTEKALKTENIPSKSSFEETLRTDPFRLIIEIAPTFLSSIGNNPAIEKQLRKALKAIAPFANELILSEDFKAYLKQEEGRLNKNFKDILPMLSSTTKKNIFYLMILTKTFIKTFQEKLYSFIANQVVEAHALRLKRDALSTTDKEAFDQSISPLKLWLFTGLPEFSKRAPFIQTLTSFGSLFLNTSFGQWIGGGIGGKLVQNLVKNLIDETPLSEERKSYWKQNRHLMEGIDSLVKILLPIIPKLKENHDVEYYFKKIQEINTLIQSPNPVNDENVKIVLQGVIDHFLDDDLPKYEGAVLATLHKTKETLENYLVT